MRGCNGETVRAQAPGMLGVCWGKELEFGAEEMAYVDKSTGCSPEDSDSIPSTHRASHNCLDLQFQGL